MAQPTDIKTKISNAAIDRGINPALAIRIAKTESELDPLRKNTKSTASGLYQITAKSWKDYGGAPGKQFDEDENIRVGLNIIQDTQNKLGARLKRPTTDTDIYTGHVLGWPAATAILKANQDRPVQEVIQRFYRQTMGQKEGNRTAARVIASNPEIFRDQRTVGDLAAVMSKKIAAPAAVPAPAAVQIAEQDMSRPVTANQNLLQQGERMREQRSPAAAPKVSLTPIQQFGVDNVGAGFQAALGFSMLGASGLGLPTAEDEEDKADEETVALAPTARQDLSSLQSIPSFDAFAAQRQAQPVQLAKGGSLDDLGDDTGVVGYNPVVESTPTASPQTKLNLRRQTASKAMSQIPATDGTSGKKSKEKEAAKGTARQQLQELQYKTGLTSLAIKDKLLGLGGNTLGAPTFTARGKLERGPLSTASFNDGGEAKKDPLGVAAKMLSTFNEYGKKAEEYGVKARDFLVANGISPTDIATGFMKLKSGVPFGLATYSGSLNEDEDEQLKEMMRRPKPVPVPRAGGSPQEGETARQQLRQQPPPKHFAWGGTAANPYYYNATTKNYTNTPPMVDNPDYTPDLLKGTPRDPGGNNDFMGFDSGYYTRLPSVVEEMKNKTYAMTPEGQLQSRLDRDKGYVFMGPGSSPENETTQLYQKRTIFQDPSVYPSANYLNYGPMNTPKQGWNQSRIVDPKSGYTRVTSDAVTGPTREQKPVIVPTTTAGVNAPVVRDNPYARPATPNPWEPGGEVRIPEDNWNEQMYSPTNFKKTNEYQDYVKSQEGGMQTQDMYDSPYFGGQTSGSYGRGLDEAYKKWAGSNAPAMPGATASPPTGPAGPANNAGINAPVVRNNPYAMPTTPLTLSNERNYIPPVTRAEGSPPEGEKPLKDQVVGWMRNTEKAISKPLGLIEIRNYATNRPKELGLKGEEGGDADAMRHLLLAREMRTKFPRTAGGMLWAHEAVFSNPIFPGQSDKERAQDEHNNDLAKRLMEEDPQATRDQYEKRALEAIRSGEAQSGLTKKDLKYRAEGSPEEGERSVGDRLKGYGETAASLLSGLGASIPAGYSGLMELARTRDPEMAAQEIGRRQAAMTYEPRTKSGKKSLESAAELLENLNIPAQYVGEKAFEASGNSPLAGAAAETLLDPINFIPGAKGLGKLGKKGVLKAIENASVPGDPFFAGPGGKQRGAVKPYKGTFARNSPEFIAAKENPVMSERPDVDYISNLEKYYAKARKEVDDAAGGAEAVTPEQKKAMREFYDKKAMPYFEELHGTLKDPVFESLMEGRITPYGGSDQSTAFRPYLISAAKRKQGRSGFRHPKDEDAYGDITRRYDLYTGLRPSLYYPNEQNLIGAAAKNTPQIAPVLGRGVTIDGQYIPNKPLSKSQASDAEKTRTVDFIRKQLETQQTALPPILQNQYLNPPDTYKVSVKEPGSLYSSTADNSTKAALSDMDRNITKETAPPLTLLEKAKSMLTSLPVEKKQENTVSNKMLEAMTRNEPIWDIGDNTSTYGPLNFLSPEHLNDYMRTLPPEKIRGMNFTQMVEESSKNQAYKAGIDKLIDDIGAGKSVDPKVFSRGMSEPIKTYEDGFRWVKANDETALKLNGKSVGHCLQAGAKNCSLSGGVGGTGRKSFDSGDTEIYFLQDERGVPVTTVEVKDAKDPTKRTISQTKGNGTKTGDTAPNKYDAMVHDFVTTLNPVKISESPTYLSPMMKELRKILDETKFDQLPRIDPDLQIRDGGLVQRPKRAARLLKEMPRTQHAYR